VTAARRVQREQPGAPEGGAPDDHAEADRQRIRQAADERAAGRPHQRDPVLQGIMNPDPFDADLSAARDAVDNIGAWLTIWSYRREPDAHARRCASNAIGAADTAIAALHRIRAQLVTQVRQADDQAAARAGELLARTRGDPPGQHGHPRPGCAGVPRLAQPPARP
jgi:hypothetical protein